MFNKRIDHHRYHPARSVACARSVGWMGLISLMFLFLVSMSGQAMAADDHGDTFGTATGLTVGTPIGGSIEVAGDLDWFSFTALDTKPYVIETSSLSKSPAMDSIITLYETDGTTVTTTGLAAGSFNPNDDCGSLASCISWTATAGATFYVEVKHFNAAGGTGTYTLTVTDITALLGADDHPNSAPGTLVGGGDGTLNVALESLSSLGDIEVGGDVDYFRFIVDAALTTNLFNIATSDQSAGSDTVITLFAAGIQQAENDDCGSLDSCININLVTGTYNVRVAHFNAAAGTGTYTLTVTDKGAVTDGAGDTYDDTAPTPIVLTAAALTTPTPYTTESINFGGDIDYFEFTTASAFFFTIKTTVLAGGMDSVITLEHDHDASSTTPPLVLAINDDGNGGICGALGDDLASCIGATLISGDKYYVKVRHFDIVSGSGDYDLTVEDTGAVVPDDHDEMTPPTTTLDPLNGATSITAITRANPGVVTSAAHGLTGGELVSITGVVGMTELNGGLYTVGFIDAATFSLVGTDTSGFTAYVSMGDVEEAILTGGVIEVGGDEDWFKFTTAAGATTALINTTTLAGGMDTVIELWDIGVTGILFANDDNGASLASRIEATSLAGATMYVVKVKHFNSVTGTGSYDLTVSSP